MHKILFYHKFIKSIYMFRAICAHHQEVKIVYTTSGVITPVGGRPVHRLREFFSQPVHRTATSSVMIPDVV
jgi:abortive infection bacteriophage resistance protein